MNIDDPKYLEETFIMRNADADGYDRPEFTELSGVKVITVDALNKYCGEHALKNELRGSIIYKCVPVFVIANETVLKPVE